MNPQIIQVFQNPQICLQLQNEMIKKFSKYRIRGFQITQHHRYEFLKDNYPIGFIVQIQYHPNLEEIDSLTKEEIFDCFNGTILQNIPLYIRGELVL
jgi:hypothetical protein